MALATHGNTSSVISDCSTSVTVPPTAAAHLSYYFDTVLTLVGNDDPAYADLRNYASSRRLTNDQLLQIMMYCLEFSPDEFIGTLMIQDEALCGDANNKMLSVSQIDRSMLVADSTVIGGQRHFVTTMMAFKPIWMVKFWIAPMKFLLKQEVLADKLAKVRQMVPSVVFIESIITFEIRPTESSCCTIL